MAEAATAAATFKLVLVGDGGTGKVRRLRDELLLVQSPDATSPGLAYSALKPFGTTR
jgi:hypothetical protein